MSNFILVAPLSGDFSFATSLHNMITYVRKSEYLLNFLFSLFSWTIFCLTLLLPLLRWVSLVNNFRSKRDSLYLLG